MDPRDHGPLGAAASASGAPSGHHPVDRFLVQLARAMHEAGAPAHRLEAHVGSCAERLGVQVTVFSLPTWISISVGDDEGQRTSSFRVEPGLPRIALLEEIDRIADEVAEGRLDAESGLVALRAARLHQPRRSGPVDILALGLFSAGAASFLGGGLPEMAAALPVGASVGLVQRLSRGRRERELLADFAAAAAATVATAVVALAAFRLGGGFSGAVVSLAGIITLLPGLTLATAMSEIATRNLTSGSARLIGALCTLVVIAMGATLGDRVVEWIPFLAVPVKPATTLVIEAPHEWGEALFAMALTSIGLGIAFGVRWSRMPVVFTACIVGLVGSIASHALVGDELAPVLAAAVVGLAGNAYARFLRRPSVSIVLPGIALLLPGSVGYRGVRGIIGSDTLGGVQTGLDALVVAAAIAAGLLLANALLRPPRGI